MENVWIVSVVLNEPVKKGRCMKIISFGEGQRGKEWLDWRRNGIGASDISVLMGTNPYKTPLALWDEKCGFKGEDSITPPMAHGIENEDKARQWLNKHQKLNLLPICVEDMEHSFYKASLDGYDEDQKVLVEIKCPVSPQILAEAQENKKIPLYWEHQIQWQIMLCQPIRAFVAVWDPIAHFCSTVESFAQPLLQKEMREKASEFWRKVKMGIPPQPSPKDYIKVEDPDLEALLIKYKEHYLWAQETEATKKKLRAKIVEYGDDGNFTCNGYYITRCSPHVKYDLDKMRSDGIDVDSYQKKNTGIGYYKISCPKS